MRNLSIILFLLLMVGCRAPSSSAPVSHFDAAIENLSIAEGQLDAVQEEKDFFVKVLEDFEIQKSEYGNLLGPVRLHGQMRDFKQWHHDISRRERDIEVQYNLNVLAAHSQIARRSITNFDKNEVAVINP